MSIDNPGPDVIEDSAGEYSSSKNVFGMEIERARKVGNIGLLLWVPITLFLIVEFLSNPTSLWNIVLLPFGGMGVVFFLYYRVSERTVMDYGEKAHRVGVEDGEGGETTKAVCRECHEEISPNVNRCPNCGWKPKKRGGLWWATTAVMSQNPIGLAMGAKGASDKYKAWKGVSKEVPVRDEEGEKRASNLTENDPADTLERLNELKEQGAITESEFKEKKDELLDQI